MFLSVSPGFSSSNASRVALKWLLTHTTKAHINSSSHYHPGPQSVITHSLQNSYSRYNLTLPPDDTVNRIILAQPYSLESYRSLEDKLALLDTALGTMDGSAVLATVLHLKKSVKKSIFTTVSRKRNYVTIALYTWVGKEANPNQRNDFLCNVNIPLYSLI